MFLRPRHKFHKGRKFVMRSADIALIANHFQRIVPIGFHLYQLKICRFVKLPSIEITLHGFRVVNLLQIFRNARLRKFPHNPTLSRARDSCKKEEGLGADGGEEGAKLRLYF